MIISCPNCKKKFEVVDNLIPESGRLLQCSGCSNKWFFKNEISIFKPKLFNPKKIYFSKVSKYKYDSEELLIIRAKIALINKTNPLAASNLKNHLKGLDM